MQVQVQQQFEAYSFRGIRQRWRMLNCSMYSGITYKYRKKPFDLLSDDKVEERKDTHDGDIFWHPPDQRRRKGKAGSDGATR